MAHAHRSGKHAKMPQHLILVPGVHARHSKFIVSSLLTLPSHASRDSLRRVQAFSHDRIWPQVLRNTDLPLAHLLATLPQHFCAPALSNFLCGDTLDLSGQLRMHSTMLETVLRRLCTPAFVHKLAALPVRRLALDSNCLGDEHFSRLAPILAHLTGLTALELQQNSLGNVGVGFVTDYLPGLPLLQVRHLLQVGLL